MAEASGEIDVGTLSEDKIKALMATDPRFISRLITQLDSNMGKMVERKRKKLEEMAAWQAEMDKLDHMISSHVQPNINRLTTQVAEKIALRDASAVKLGEQKTNLVKMERDAAALISSIKGKTSKLMKNTASQRLEELRGFSTNVPTTTLVRGGATGQRTKSSAAGSPGAF
ncbi:hypothetical protein FOA52_015484 [Chlamydomonas sp. UWO 241]|nr:hypothetical protein FOA52_015484 [Chlamydomonas sp. UWO 241]